MKLKDFKFDRGWKILIYFDLLLPLMLFLLAWLMPIQGMKGLFAVLFHSYGLYVMSPIPHFAALTGIIGLLYHAGILGYTLKKRRLLDLLICALITLAVVLYFMFEINYQVIKPLSFS